MSITNIIILVSAFALFGCVLMWSDFISRNAPRDQTSGAGRLASHAPSNLEHRDAA